ncbi:MAG: C40 family peptidase [Bifidobacteriaceae bacterium]|jgi:cell wall-associated NlpC family hydrolase|nr:C40 family peptidase [Bifidobacteriaceae bacterium]
MSHRLRARKRGWLLAAALVAVLVAAAPASADPTPAPSSDAAVEEAKRQEALAAASVAEIEAMLADLRGETERAEEEAALAAEAYNQAQEELGQANLAVEEASADAEESQAALTQARGALARVALMNAQSGSDIAALEPLLNSGGIEEAASKSAMLFVVGSAADRAASKFAAAKQAADQAGVRSARAVELQTEKSAAARQKAGAAQQATEAAQRAEADAEVRHQEMLQVLAQKKNTTVAAEAAAEKRQLEEANEAARREAERASQAQRPSNGASQGSTGSGGGATTTPATGGDSGGGGGSTPTSPSEGGSGGGTTPPPTTPSDGAEAGLAALAWARAQIGKPYQWGGNGPNSFDCSGLTQQAWKNGGGKSIPRVAADQYALAQKIPYESMRPGDLIFWQRGGAPIHHVAMYAGNGMMVEAMQTGTNIHEIPIRWANTVQYAGRY